MPASIYKDSTLTGGFGDRYAKLFRWLTGETQGDLNTAGPGGGGVTVKIVEAWDSTSNARSVSSDGTMDGLAATSLWRDPSLGAIVDGWIVLEFSGTGLNGNTGFQWLWQVNATDELDATNSVIPRKDWVTDDGGTSAYLSTKELIGAETTSGLTSGRQHINGSWSSANAIYYCWADNGMVMIASDDPAQSRHYWVTYAGEVDNPAPGDTYPFIASHCFEGSPNWMFCGQNATGADIMYSRVSPVDGESHLLDARPMTLAITVDTDAWNSSGPALADFGGYPRSPIGVAFTTGGHSHVAGTLRYVMVTHENTGARWTSDNMTRIGWSVGDARQSTPICGWSMDWDGTTPHP